MVRASVCDMMQLVYGHTNQTVFVVLTNERHDSENETKIKAA